MKKLVPLFLVTILGSIPSLSSEHAAKVESKKAVPTKEESRTPPSSLPSQASEDDVEILDPQTRTNKISDLSKLSNLAKFQVALESARNLREIRELKRAERAFIQLLEGRAPEEIKRAALLDLAMVMQEQKEYTRAQHLFSLYVRRYEKDPSVPEVLLRQAYLYREMGIPPLALSKLYAVISTSLNLEVGKLEYYQKLVLRAQAEIAETYLLDGKFDEATDYLERLLRLNNPDLAVDEVLSKLVRCHSSNGKFTETIANARLFIEKFPDHTEVPETRFLLARALKNLDRKQEALHEISALLEGQQGQSKSDPQRWFYWQQRAGNEIANQLYREGDYMSALQVYQSLAAINTAAEWQLPVWYQIGLIFENLKQRPKASEMYEKIMARHQEATAKMPNPALTQVAEMAAWRHQYINWEARAQLANEELKPREPSEKPL